MHSLSDMERKRLVKSCRTKPRVGVMIIIMVLVCTTIFPQPCNGFGPQVFKTARSTTPRLGVQPLSTKEEEEKIEKQQMDWKTSNSMGSVLLRMQQEQETTTSTATATMTPTKTKTKSTTTKSAATDTTPNNSNSNKDAGVAVLEVDSPTRTKSGPLPPPPSNDDDDDESQLLSPMDLETAQELDQAVTHKARQELLDDLVDVLDLPHQYQPTSEEEAQQYLRDMPLSRPEHHRDRIGREIRLVATSVASSVEDEWQWRLFCEQEGGVETLLRCIRDGARFLERQVQTNNNWQTDEAAFANLVGQYQQFYGAACSACRALRDLAALSPEMAAVMTDELLRANHATQGRLLDDIASLLVAAENDQHLLQQMTTLLRQQQQQQQQPNKNKRLGLSQQQQRPLVRIQGGRQTRRGKNTRRESVFLFVCPI